MDVQNGNVPLLLAGGSAIVTLNPDTNQFTVAGTIFDEDASLVRRTGYMVFWSHMLHRLVGWRMPSKCGIVAQLAMPPGRPVDFPKLLKQVGPMAGGMKPQQVLGQATQMLVKAVEMTGNIRFQSVTMGVADRIDNDNGFVVFIVRGLYDAKAITALLGEQRRTQTETVNGFEVIKPDRELAMILPSNDMLVFCTGPRRSPLPLGEVTTAIKTGIGGLKPASDLGKLIKTIDTSQPVWAAATITDTYRQAGPIISAFKTITLGARSAKDSQTFTVTGKGSDPKLVAQAVAALKGIVEMGKAELSGEIARGRPHAGMIKPILAFLKTIQVTADGATATATATLKGTSLSAIVPAFLMSYSDARMVDHGPPPEKIQPVPVPQAPVEHKHDHN